MCFLIENIIVIACKHFMINDFHLEWSNSSSESEMDLDMLEEDMQNVTFLLE